MGTGFDLVHGLKHSNTHLHLPINNENRWPIHNSIIPDTHNGTISVSVMVGHYNQHTMHNTFCIQTSKQNEQNSQQ